MDYEIRWMEHKDMQRCAEIDSENLNPTTAWTVTDFANELHEKNTIGQVIDVNGEVAGFYVYLLQNHQIVILHMGVAKSWQRKGLATAMLDKLKKKLRVGRRQRILAPVRERLLGAQLFMKANGFKAVLVVPENYVDTGEDAFMFKYDSPELPANSEVTTESEVPIDI